MQAKLFTLCTALCAVCLSATSQNVPDYVPTDGLVAWYPFNGNANDESGNGNDGIAENVTLEFDRFGNPNAAFGFQGQNCCGQPDELVQQVVIENSIINLGDDYSVSAWFLSANLEKYQQCLFNSIPHTGFAVEYNNEHAPDVTCVGLGPGNAYWNTLYQHGPFADYTENQWYQVVFVKQNANFYLYIDGALDWESTYGFADGYNLEVGIRFGSIGGGHQIMNGSLDDCGIWNRALTEEEILALFTGEIGIPGCIDPTACNYNEEATEDDGSCQFAPSFFGNDTIVSTCPGAPIQFGIEVAEEDPYLDNPGTPNPWPAGSLEAGGAIPLGVFGTPSNFSVAFSVNPSPEQNGHSIMFDASHGGSSNWVLQNLGDGWGFLGHEIPITAGIWQDVLITYSSCEVNFYVNGELTSQVSHCINYAGNPSWYMGNWPEGGRRFTGSIDDVLYSHEVLTPDAIAMGADAPGVVQFYAFDEGEGDETVEQISMISNPLNGWSWEALSISNGTISWDGVENIETLPLFQDTTLTYVWSNDFCEVSGAVDVVIITNVGCTDSDACNYSPEAECDDNSCAYPLIEGSDCETGGIFCGEGTIWDHSIQACVCFNDCPSDLNGNGIVEVTDLLTVLADFGSECPPEVQEWTCGDPVNYHGYDYATVQIGGQCWFAENLQASAYANGDAIPEVLENSEWQSTYTDAQAYYDGNLANVDLYGRLYNWYAVNDSRSLCKSGWKVPSDDEWKIMEMALGLTESQADGVGWRGDGPGTAMRSNPSDSPSWNGTNTSGFSGLRGGFRTAEGAYTNLGDGTVDSGVGAWWTATMNSANPWGRALGNLQPGIDRNSVGSYLPQAGMSVRCLKDSEE